MKKTLTTLILCALTPAALAADTYGYLAMWQNPADSNEALQIKTTKENATQLDATAELETFCKGQDALAGIGAGQATGCKTVVPLHNTCIAVAYPKAMGKLTAQKRGGHYLPTFQNRASNCLEPVHQKIRLSRTMCFRNSLLHFRYLLSRYGQNPLGKNQIHLRPSENKTGLPDILHITASRFFYSGFYLLFFSNNLATTPSACFTKSGLVRKWFSSFKE